MPHRKKPHFRNIYHPAHKLPENDLGEPPGSGSPVIFCLQLVCEKPCQQILVVFFAGGHLQNDIG